MPTIKAGATFAALAILTAVGIAAPPLAAQGCEPTPPRVSTDRDGERVQLFLDVPGHATIVLLLDAELVNMRADRPLPIVATYPPGRRIHLLTLIGQRPTPGQRWSLEYQFSWAWGDHRAVHDDAYHYRLPYDDHAGYPLIQGPDGTFSHAGQQAYDWAMPVGTPVLAAREGLVVETCDVYRAGGPDRALLDRANYIHIQHEDGTLARYVHLVHGGVRVRPGDRVARGQLIGLSGNTGFSAGPHLHFEVVRRLADLRIETVPVRFEGDP
jgi:murein DD-endopeptidase MepM/ murein hydrolase activator NlpD